MKHEVSWGKSCVHVELTVLEREVLGYITYLVSYLGSVAAG